MKISILKAVIPIVIALVAAAPTQAQKKNNDNKYRISLTIEGNKDSVMYLGCYYGKSNYVIDTALRDKKGRFVFSQENRKLFPGMYFFSNTAGKYVEIVVYNEEPNFTFETVEDDWTYQMQVKGSEQNEIFFNYHRLTTRLFRDIDEKRATLDSTSLQEYYRNANKAADSIRNDIIARYPDAMISKIMNATREVSIPETDSTGKPLTANDRFYYYMDHFFDNMPLDEDMIVRTPKAIFYNRIMYWLDKAMSGVPPEIIIKYVDKAIDKARPAKETFKWLVHTISEKYLQSPIMVYDEIYVHMVKKYYATGEAFWASPSVIEEQVIRAEKWEKLLVGKVAPELVMKDTLNTFHSLHAFPHNYKLLLFWSPTCGHCKTEIPELYNVYKKYEEEYGIGVYAILSEPDDHTRKLWKEFIAKYNLDWLNIDGGEANVDWREVYDIVTTPQAYLLDKDNVIVAKKLNAEILENVIKKMLVKKNDTTTPRTESK